MALLDEMESDSAEPEVRDGPHLKHLVQLGLELEALKDELDRIDAERSLVQERYDRLRKVDIPDVMHQAGIASDGRGSFTTATGARISLRTELHAGFSKDQEPEVFDWVTSLGSGDLIRPQIHSQTFKSFVREQLAEGVAIPQFVRQYYETTCVMTRAKKRGDKNGEG